MVLLVQYQVFLDLRRRVVLCFAFLFFSESRKGWEIILSYTRFSIMHSTVSIAWPHSEGEGEGEGIKRGKIFLTFHFPLFLFPERVSPTLLVNEATLP